MGVGADDGRNFSIEKTSDRDFLARGLAMSIDENDRRLLAHFRDGDLERGKRILENRLHERPGLHVDHAHLPLRCFEHDRAAAGRAVGIIERAQQTRLRVDEAE